MVENIVRAKKRAIKSAILILMASKQRSLNDMDCFTQLKQSINLDFDEEVRFLLESTLLMDKLIAELIMEDEKLCN